MELNAETACGSPKSYRYWKCTRMRVLAMGITSVFFLAMSNLLHPTRRTDKTPIPFISTQFENSDLLTTTITDIENVQSCGLGKEAKTLFIPEDARNNLIISINSSNMTSYRLCPLIASIHAQASYLDISVHVTVFVDELIAESSLCGMAQVIVWEPLNQHER
jgi:hypothetical protein